MDTKYILVNHSTRINEVGAYLYNHTEIINTVRVARMQLALLETAAASGVDYLADYQADRIRSGLFGVRVFDTLEEATAALEADAREYGSGI